MLGKFVRDYLTKNRSPNRGSNMFRIGAAGKCYLYRCFLREGVKESNPYTQDILGIFTIGNFIHEWLQAALDEKGILLDQELKITYPEWEATGRFDALIKKDDLVYLYDFKTVNSKKYQYLREPSKNYIYQIVTYYLITLATTKYKKIDKVCIAYISKDSLKIKEFFIEVHDLKLLKDVVDDWETLSDIWRNKKHKNITKFREEYADYLQNDAGCSMYCVYYEYCHNLK